jgi:hypothetical protein
MATIVAALRVLPSAAISASIAAFSRAIRSAGRSSGSMIAKTR